MGKPKPKKETKRWKEQPAGEVKLEEEEDLSIIKEEQK